LELQVEQWEKQIEQLRKKLEHLEKGDTEVEIPIKPVFKGLENMDRKKAAQALSGDFGLGTVMSDDERTLYNAKRTTQDNVSNAINEVVGAFDAGLFSEEQAKSFIDKLNEYLQNMGLEPIPINIDDRDVYKKLAKIGNTVGTVASSMANAFGALGQVLGDDGHGANVMKIVAQAVATLALSFAQAMNDKVTRGGGIWTWIAGGISGMATLLTMTAQLKNAQKYAQGGIIGGSSYFGDKMFVRVNSGEAILNGKQQRRMFDILDGKGAFGSALQHQEITWRIKGGDLYGALRNYTHIKNKTTNIKTF